MPLDRRIPLNGLTYMLEEPCTGSPARDRRGLPKASAEGVPTLDLNRLFPRITGPTPVPPKWVLTHHLA